MNDSYTNILILLVIINVGQSTVYGCYLNVDDKSLADDLLSDRVLTAPWVEKLDPNASDIQLVSFN